MEEEKKVTEFKWLKFKVKVKQAVDSAKETVKKAVVATADFCRDHPVEASLVAGAVVKAVKVVNKVAVVGREERDKRRRFYDNRLGRYSRSRRDLTGREELEIERRYRGGESYREILDDLGLLK